MKRSKKIFIKKTVYKRIFYVICILGLVVLLVVVLLKKELRKDFFQKKNGHLVEQVFCQNALAEKLLSEQKSVFSIENPLSVFEYVNQYANCDKMQVDKDLQTLALLFPGKNEDFFFWSGASCEKIAYQQYFGNSQDTLGVDDEIHCQNEENSEFSVQADLDSEMEAAALVENENFRENHKEIEEEESEQTTSVSERMLMRANQKKIMTLQETCSLSYLLKNFYIVDSSTSINPNVFNVENLLKTDLTMTKKNEPQILIYHTHGASERFVDSKPGDTEESVIGVGSVLADILEKKYGYSVIHDTTPYDSIHGKIDRNKAYNKAYLGLKSILKKHPEIQVVIDLHRDGVGNGVHRLTKINGKKTAQVMFFNGLSRNHSREIHYLKNKNLPYNLAFSLQMKIKAMEEYPDFAKPVYLKGYRYNLHMRRRSLLIELGNENNTLEEAQNAMEPLAKVLNEVLSEH